MLKISRDPFLRFTTLILITSSLLSYGTEARLHYYNDIHNPNSYPEPPYSSFSQSQPPSISPDPDDLSQPPSPCQDLDQEVVHDVRNYGAVGDGITDDTGAFKTAWDSACSNDEDNNTVSILLVPFGFTFVIHSTIFTGPCRSYQYFQVFFFFQISKSFQFLQDYQILFNFWWFSFN